MFLRASPGFVRDQSNSALIVIQTIPQSTSTMPKKNPEVVEKVSVIPEETTVPEKTLPISEKIVDLSEETAEDQLVSTPKQIFYLYDMTCSGLLKVKWRECGLLNFRNSNSLLRQCPLFGMLKKRVDYIHVLINNKVIRLEPQELAGRKHYSPDTGEILGRYQKVVLLSPETSSLSKETTGVLVLYTLHLFCSCAQ